MNTCWCSCSERGNFNHQFNFFFLIKQTAITNASCWQKRTNQLNNGKKYSPYSLPRTQALLFSYVRCHAKQLSGEQWGMERERVEPSLGPLHPLSSLPAGLAIPPRKTPISVCVRGSYTYFYWQVPKLINVCFRRETKLMRNFNLEQFSINW